jgi:hypothetical protein
LVRVQLGPPSGGSVKRGKSKATKPKQILPVLKGRAKKERFLDNCIQRRRKRIQDQRRPEGRPESKLKPAFGNMIPGKYGERTKERIRNNTDTDFKRVREIKI